MFFRFVLANTWYVSPRIFLGKMVKHPSKSSPIQLVSSPAAPAVSSRHASNPAAYACRGRQGRLQVGQTKGRFLPVFGAGMVLFVGWISLCLDGKPTCFRRMLFIFCYGDLSICWRLHVEIVQRIVAQTHGWDIGSCSPSSCQDQIVSNLAG